MKFVVSSKVLLEHLQNANRIISPQPSMPVLEYVKLTVKDQVLSLYSTDADLTINTSFPLEAIEEEGAVCIPAKLLLDTLKEFSDMQLSFTVDPETFRINVSYNDGQFSGQFMLTGMDAKEFAEEVKLVDNQVVSLSLDADILRDVLAKAEVCTTQNLSAVSGALYGVLFEIDSDGLKAYATDAYQVAKVYRKDVTLETKQSVLIPLKAVKVILQLFANHDDELEFAFDENNIRITTPSIQFFCRLLEQTIPPLENVFSNELHETLILNTEVFIHALRILSPYTQSSSKMVNIKISEQVLELKARTIDNNALSKQTLVCQFEGESKAISINLFKMLTILQQIKSQDVSIALGTTNHIKISPLPQENEHIELTYILSKGVSEEKWEEES